MNKNTTIAHQVNDAMNSLDGIQSATPGPFFLTRVQARLQRDEKNGWEKAVAFICRPAVAITMTCLVICINAVVIFQYNEPQPEASIAMADQTEQSVYEEFNTASDSFYEFEIKEP